MIEGLYNIEAGVNSLHAVAKTLHDETHGDFEQLRCHTLLLPTRRSIRVLEETLLQSFAQPTILLPRIMAIGDIEIPPADDEVIAPPPRPINGIERLNDIVHFLEKHGYATGRFEAQWHMAGEIARVIDLLQTEGLSPDDLNQIAPENLSAHWQMSVGLFQRVAKDWLAHLDATKRINHAAARNRRIHQLIDQWHNKPPTTPVWVIGSTGSIPAVRALMQAVLKLDSGAVVLPGVDYGLDDAAWNAIGDAHPQSILKKTITELGYDKREIKPWPHQNGSPVIQDRLNCLRHALSPTPSAYMPQHTHSIGIVSAPSYEAEIEAIALYCAQTLSKDPQKQITILSNDPALPDHIKPLLAHYAIHCDASAGFSVAKHPVGMACGGLIRIAHDRGDITGLWGWLKNPLCMPTWPIKERKETLTKIEHDYLRDPLKCPDTIDSALALLGDSCAAITDIRQQAQSARTLSAWAIFWQSIIDAHIVATTRSAQLVMETITRALDDLRTVSNTQLIAAHDACGIFTDHVLQISYRDPAPKTPFVHIIGTMEARLMHSDCVILTGMNEGTWPDTPKPSPFLSRAMRHAVGLPDSERHAALSGHDFQQAFAMSDIVITRAARTSEGPTLPARWLQRLKTILPDSVWKEHEQRGQTLLDSLSAQYATDTIIPAAPPAPTLGNHDLLPKPLSVTAVELWRHDPFSFWAGRLMRLRALDPFLPDIDAATRGTVWHDFLKRFAEEFDPRGDAEYAEKLYADIITITLDSYANLPSSWRRVWKARLLGARDSIIDSERVRRSDADILSLEQSYTATIAGVELYARADRVDETRDHTLRLYDYKTGQAPTQTSVKEGLYCQLTLLALLCLKPVETIEYLEIKGGQNAVKSVSLPFDAEFYDATRAGFAAWCDLFLVQKHPFICLADHGNEHKKKAQDYLHLARYQEWEGRT